MEIFFKSHLIVNGNVVSNSYYNINAIFNSKCSNHYSIIVVIAADGFSKLK